MKLSQRRSHGFSLVELLVAMVAGLIVAGTVVAFLLSSMKSNGEYVQSTRLTQELRNTLDLVTRDLRRTGYNNDSISYLTPGSSTPFSSVFVKDTSPTGLGSEDLDGCIVYAYDSAYAVNSATTGIGKLDLSAGEVRGIRRVVATMPDGSTIGVLEYAKSEGNARPVCATEATPTYTNYPPDCHSLWCPLSDPAKLNITEFKVVDRTELIGVNPDALKVRELEVNIKGQLAGSAEFTRGVRGGIRIRSDCFKPATADCNVSP